jgi:hypothetical protein
MRASLRKFQIATKGQPAQVKPLAFADRRLYIAGLRKRPLNRP